VVDRQAEEAEGKRGWQGEAKVKSWATFTLISAAEASFSCAFSVAQMPSSQLQILF
jgi:hypothetical protein